jgi:hypothetical protein
MLCVGWDRNEVALLAQQGEDFLVGFFLVKPKKALAFNKDTHFILGVSMFSEEFLSDPGQIRGIPVYIDDIRRLVPSLYHERLEQVVVGGENLLVRGSGE